MCFPIFPTYDIDLGSSWNRGSEICFALGGALRCAFIVILTQLRSSTGGQVDICKTGGRGPLVPQISPSVRERFKHGQSKFPISSSAKGAKSFRHAATLRYVDIPTFFFRITHTRGVRRERERERKKSRCSRLGISGDGGGVVENSIILGIIDGGWSSRRRRTEDGGRRRSFKRERIGLGSTAVHNTSCRIRSFGTEEVNEHVLSSGSPSRLSKERRCHSPTHHQKPRNFSSPADLFPYLSRSFSA